jgi:hypothetical protein
MVIHLLRQLTRGLKEVIAPLGQRAENLSKTDPVGAGGGGSVATDRRDRSSRQIKAVVLSAADGMIRSQLQQARGNAS